MLQKLSKNISAILVLRKLRTERLSLDSVENYSFRPNETIRNLNKDKSDRSREVTIQENIDAVHRSAVQNPKKSSQRRSKELGVSRTSVVRILKVDLKLAVSYNSEAIS